MTFGEFIEKNLLVVGELSRAKFGKVSSTVKTEDTNQVLTETDLEIGTVLLTAISASYPNHNTIDEETGSINRESEYTWVVDPIDGTSNFANGIPMYGTLLGLLYKDEPVAGGMILPFFNDLYVAERGTGTLHNGTKTHVTAENKLINVLVGYGIDSHKNEAEKTQEEMQTLGRIIDKIRNLRTSNSVFDAAMVIDGRYGAFLNRNSKIWDNIAQHILIEEAGGVYTDFFGHPMNYQNALNRIPENFTWCAGAPDIHKQLQHIIHSQ